MSTIRIKSHDIYRSLQGNGDGGGVDGVGDDANVDYEDDDDAVYVDDDEDDDGDEKGGNQKFIRTELNIIYTTFVC